MRTGFLECFAGISGDMMLGALIDAGVPQDVMEQAVEALHIGARLRFSRVDRSGIRATKVDVLVGEELAEAGEHEHAHPHEPGLSHTHTHQHEHTHSHSHEHVHEAGHEHSHEHVHEHFQEATHTHGHGRSWRQIRELISNAGLSAETKALALCAFGHLAEAEGRIHGMPAEEVHFHEVGSVDAIADIVCSAAGLSSLNVGQWSAGPINVGSGMVECAHGLYPVPAPATLELLRGMPTYSAGPQVEMVTPTGAALLRALAPSFTSAARTAETIGYGAGTRNPARFPNVLRLSVGVHEPKQEEKSGAANTEAVSVVECALDDASPQLLAHVMELALSQGALDVMATPVTMKKSRLGTLLTVLAPPELSGAIEDLLLRETTTLGLRVREEQRRVLVRRFETAATEYGAIAIKIAGEGSNIMPEFEDCRRAALAYDVPLKQVQQAAVTAYQLARREVQV